jgi:hypothetical protein
VDPVTALCRVLGRHKMYVDLRDTGFAPHLMFEGYWEYWITEFIWRNAKPGQVALDVGANHGYYTLLLADLVGPNGKVHAFEPNPRLAELLGQNIALNGYWHVADARAAAVGDRTAAPRASSCLCATRRTPTSCGRGSNSRRTSTRRTWRCTKSPWCPWTKPCPGAPTS